MTREEIKKQIEKLENRQFMLMMKDRWNRKDYELNNDLCIQIRNLENELMKFE